MCRRDAAARVCSGRSTPFIQCAAAGRAVALQCTAEDTARRRRRTYVRWRHGTGRCAGFGPGTTPPVRVSVTNVGRGDPGVRAPGGGALATALPSGTGAILLPPPPVSFVAFFVALTPPHGRAVARRPDSLPAPTPSNARSSVGRTVACVECVNEWCPSGWTRSHWLKLAFTSTSIRLETVYERRHLQTNTKRQLDSWQDASRQSHKKALPIKTHFGTKVYHCISVYDKANEQEGQKMTLRTYP